MQEGETGWVGGRGKASGGMGRGGKPQGAQQKSRTKHEVAAPTAAHPLWPKKCVTNSVYIWATNSVHLRHSTELTNKLPPILSNWIPRPKYLSRTLCIFDSRTVYIWDKARSCRSNWCDHPLYCFSWRELCVTNCVYLSLEDMAGETADGVVYI